MKKIKLFDPLIDFQEKIAINRVLDSKYWASGSGEGYVKKFENLFCNYVNSKKCIAVNSGTSALHLALSLFDIKNKEVILPSITFASTAHAILYNGGIPIFADILPDTLCLDPKSVLEKLSKKTKMIVPVHFAGMSCEMNELKKIAKINNLKIVEDAAHAAGSEYKKKKIGSIGDAVCFSFHPVKNLAMPSGGAITLNGNNLKKFEELLKIRRWCGISNRIGYRYDINEIGWNFYMNEFSASMGIVQLKKLNKMNKIRKKIAKMYSEHIELQNKMQFDEGCSYHIYWIQVKNRNSFMKKMRENGIETGIHYRPLHKMKLFSKKEKLPITDKVENEIVSIPIHPNLSEKDVEKIITLTNKLS